MDLGASKFKLEIELEQQTPMIHFQHNQDGATLRATEVKPKLDKMLIQLQNKHLPAAWQLPKPDERARTALNYKMRIEANAPFEKSKIKMGIMRLNNKEAIFYTKPIKLTIICFIPDLLTEIQKHIQGFFLLHNFGTRQNKGFGSFKVTKINNQSTSVNVVNEIKKYFNNSFYYVKYNSSGQKKERMNTMMKDINKLYEIMKSGEKYSKPYIYQYMDKYSIINEKDYLKENLPLKFQNIPTVKVRNKEENRKPRYVKAMLGLGGGFQFNRKKDGYCTQIDISHDTIKRYASPITFKVIDNFMYILPYNPNPCILGAVFCFKDKNEPDDKIEIKTPTAAEFDMNNFMESFVIYYNQLKNKKIVPVKVGEPNA